jgi:phosphoglycolate phosphatase
VDLKRFGSNVPSRSIIFDLDGTLIDSQESIVNAIKLALEGLGLESNIPITRDLIGPPLSDTLLKITNVRDSSSLELLVDEFKLHYDSEGYKDCQVYPGINDLLKNLHTQGCTLYIATNKRLMPTKKIVDYLSWGSLFSGVYSIDLNAERPFKNKGEMISALLYDKHIDISSAIYVGDRVEDYEAAKANRLPCVLVAWGYGNPDLMLDDNPYVVSNPDGLLNALQEIF